MPFSKEQQSANTLVAINPLVWNKTQKNKLTHVNTFKYNFKGTS